MFFVSNTQHIDAKSWGIYAVPIRPAARASSGAVSAEVISAVDRYIAEGRDVGLDDGALLVILRVRLGHPQ
jgi:GntR family transcriptional regulator